DAPVAAAAAPHPPHQTPTPAAPAATAAAATTSDGTASAAAAAAAASAAAAARAGNSLAEPGSAGVFFVEYVKRPQADVDDFLFAERDLRRGLTPGRRIRGRHSGRPGCAPRDRPR